MKQAMNRYVVLFVVFTLIATIAASGISYLYSSSQFKVNTEQQLLETATSTGRELNEIIFGIETAVNVITDGLEVTFDENRVHDPSYFEEINPYLETIAKKYDQNNFNATSFYVRFDPTISSGTAGVFHADTNGDNVMERQIPTDISIYDPTDREHVGWFYEPMGYQSGDWMKPYYNANIDTYMVSFVAPLIINDQAIGIVGMDVDFKTLKNIADSYRGAGKVVIIDRDQAFMVHTDYSLSDRMNTIDNGSLAYMGDAMRMNPFGTFHYKLEGVKKVMGYTTLKNDWTVIVALTEEEAFESFNRVTSTLVRINLMVSVVLTAVAFLFSRFVFRVIARTYVLEKLVEERTKQLTDTNEYLEETVAELENKQAELILLNDQLERSLETQKEMQESLIEAEKLASLGQLVSGIAHELNTPVGNAIALNSYVEMLVEKNQTKLDSQLLTKNDLDECLSSLKESTQLTNKTLERISGLIQHFKMITHPEQLMDIKRINLRALIEETLVDYSDRMNTSHHRVRIIAEEEIDFCSSPIILKQVLRQLLENSLNHGFDELTGKEITIQIARWNGYVRLRYADNGRGIPSELEGRVFNPFVSSKKNKGYVGLGLHMVHNLVTQTLKGSITVNANVVEGFQLDLVLSDMDSK